MLVYAAAILVVIISRTIIRFVCIISSSRCSDYLIGSRHNMISGIHDGHVHGVEICSHRHHTAGCAEG